MTDFLLPDLGEGLPEAELMQWYVKVGDTIELNQPMAEVETAKAVIDLPSPYAGIVTALHHEAGQVVEVGSVLISFDTGDGSTTPAAPDAAADASDEDEPPPPNLVGYGAAPTSKKRPARRSRGGAAPAAAAVAAPVALVATETAPKLRPRSMPPVRKLAADLGVDLTALTGTGPDGLITREDVRNAVELPALPEPVASHAPSVAAGERETRTPIRGVRKVTAAAMVRSAFTAPHVTCFHTVDVTRTSELVAGLRTDRQWADQRIGVLAVVAKAVCLAISRNPTLNSAWDEAAQEIVQYHYVNLGIAAATPRGLVVPNIVDADSMNLVELSGAIRELAATAREGKTTPQAMSGGTFSISNIGTFGIEAGTPILNPGEAGILAVGAVQRRPWEFEGEIALRDIMTLSLSFDHRLVDGEQGARFLADVATILSDPARALLIR